MLEGASITRVYTHSSPVEEQYIGENEGYLSIFGYLWKMFELV